MIQVSAIDRNDPESVTSTAQGHWVPVVAILFLGIGQVELRQRPMTRHDRLPEMRAGLRSIGYQTNWPAEKRLQLQFQVKESSCDLASRQIGATDFNSVEAEISTAEPQPPSA